jgi:hypothetical protein
MHIELYYGNKTNVNLTNFSSNIFLSGELESGKILLFLYSNRNFFLYIELRINMEPIKSTIDPRAQIKQIGKIDCIREFYDLPKMNITFL